MMIMMRQQQNTWPTQLVVLVVVVSAVVSLLLTTTTNISVTDKYFIDAFHVVPLLSSKNNYLEYHRRDHLNEDRYSEIATPSSSSLDATTRRQSFGDLLGSTLALPAIVDTATMTLQGPLLSANAADDYPFKVRMKKKLEFIFIQLIHP